MIFRDVFTLRVLFKSGNQMTIEVVAFEVKKAHDNSITGLTYELFHSKEKLLYTHLDSIECIFQVSHRKVWSLFR